MKDQGPYKATLFMAVAQSGVAGACFGMTIAHMDTAANPAAAAILFTMWLAGSCWIWLWARKRFWPEDFRSQ